MNERERVLSETRLTCLLHMAWCAYPENIYNTSLVEIWFEKRAGYALLRLAGCIASNISRD